MKRRSLFAAGAGAAASAATLATPAIAQGRVQWRMVTSWPRGFPGLGVGADRIARHVGEMSGGRFTIQVFAAGQLVPPLGVFDAVTQGGAEMMHTAAYYWQNRNRGLNFFTGVPFGMTSKEIRAWIRYMGGQEIWDEIYAQFNLKGFMAADTGLQGAGWFRKEINTVADVRGLKFRTPGLGGECWRRIGAAVVNLGAVSISARAPHPRGALLFADFTLSEAGQRIYMNSEYGSAREGLGGTATNFKKSYLENQTKNYIQDFENWQRLMRSTFMR